MPDFTKEQYAMSRESVEDELRVLFDGTCVGNTSFAMQVATRARMIAKAVSNLQEASAVVRKWKGAPT